MGVEMCGSRGEKEKVKKNNEMRRGKRRKCMKERQSREKRRAKRRRERVRTKGGSLGKRRKEEED
jgi:hypothetical protein